MWHDQIARFTLGVDPVARLSYWRGWRTIASPHLLAGHEWRLPPFHFLKPYSREASLAFDPFGDLEERPPTGFGATLAL